MSGRVYDTSAFRALPRDSCALSWLGECQGLIHRHHVHGLEADETVPLCARHHPTAERLRRWTEPKRRRCPHQHRTRESREACERRLNGLTAAA